MLNNLLSKLTPKHKRWLIIGGFVALGLVLGVVFLTVPYKNKKVELEDLQTQLKQKEDERDAKRFSKEKLETEKRTKEVKEMELSRLEKELPEEEYVPTLLTMLEDLSAEIRSPIASISPSMPTSPQMVAPPAAPGGTTQAAGASAPAPAAALTYKEITMSLPYHGTYDNLKLFLNRLAQFPMVVVVTSLTVSGGIDIDPVEGVPLVTASLPTTIYVLPKQKQTKNTLKPQGS